MTEVDRVALLLDASGGDGWFALLADFVTSDPTAARASGVTLLDSDVPAERELGADVLGQVACIDMVAIPRIVDDLLSRLGLESDPDALASVIVALGHAANARASSPLLRFSEHADRDVRSAVVFALPLLGLDADALATLRGLTTDSEADIRDWATFGLAESDAHDEATLAALAARTDDPHDDTRAEAKFGLARRRDPRARGLIERELRQPTHGELIDRALEELTA